MKIFSKLKNRINNQRGSIYNNVRYGCFLFLYVFMLYFFFFSSEYYAGGGLFPTLSSEHNEGGKLPPSVIAKELLSNLSIKNNGYFVAARLHLDNSAEQFYQNSFIKLEPGEIRLGNPRRNSVRFLGLFPEIKEIFGYTFRPLNTSAETFTLFSDKDVIKMATKRLEQKHILEKTGFGDLIKASLNFILRSVGSTYEYSTAGIRNQVKISKEAQKILVEVDAVFDQALQNNVETCNDIRTQLNKKGNQVYETLVQKNEHIEKLHKECEKSECEVDIVMSPNNMDLRELVFHPEKIKYEKVPINIIFKDRPYVLDELATGYQYHLNYHKTCAEKTEITTNLIETPKRMYEVFFENVFQEHRDVFLEDVDNYRTAINAVIQRFKEQASESTGESFASLLDLRAITAEERLQVVNLRENFERLSDVILDKGDLILYAYELENQAKVEYIEELKTKMGKKFSTLESKCTKKYVPKYVTLLLDYNKELVFDYNKELENKTEARIKTEELLTEIEREIPENFIFNKD